ncbi:MAG: hypothetical protein WAQ05_00505, partial [Rubrivivax sp.]
MLGMPATRMARPRAITRLRFAPLAFQPQQAGASVLAGVPHERVPHPPALFFAGRLSAAGSPV